MTAETRSSVLAAAAALAAAGDTAGAIAAHERLLARWPDCRPAHLALGRLLRAAGRPDDALGHLREAVHLDPGDAAARFEFGLLLFERGDLARAIDALQNALRLAPDRAVARFHLGRAWLESADTARAREYLRGYLARVPEDSLGARALLARLDASPTALSPHYVRELFDQYAEGFDDELLQTLDYRAPEVLRDAVTRMLPNDRAAGLDVLDLGCGTGLAGMSFRPLARRLHGIDLSPRMIAKAKARGIYDSLVVGEMVEVLDGEKDASWDLIVAADALAYLGDLAALFRAARRALKADGLFAATTEKTEAGDIQWQASRRFAHGEDHIRRAAAAAGLAIILVEPAHCRREKGAPVPGLVFVLRAERGAPRLASANALT
jgi:predicted TPR repeat methyltransferase